MRTKPSIWNRLFIGLVFLFLYAPIFVLIVFSFNASNSRSIWAGFSLHWYVELFQDQQILDALYTTLAVSLLAALIATVAGTFSAIGFYNMRRRWRTPLMTINNIPMVNADIVTGVSLCLFFVAAFGLWEQAASWLNDTLGTALPERLYLGFGTMLIAHIMFNIPYVILSVMPKLRQMDNQLMDAAQDLGCTPVQGFFKVVLPELWPGIISGAIMAFTMSLDDFVISYFVYGNSFVTLPVEIYTNTRKQMPPKFYAMFTLMFFVILVVMILMNVIQARDESKQKRRVKGA